MKAADELKKSLFISLWFMLLTFPLMVVRVNTIEKVVEWRWPNMAYVGIGSFFLSYAWRYLLARKKDGAGKPASGINGESGPLPRRPFEESRFYRPALAALALAAR